MSSGLKLGRPALARLLGACLLVLGEPTFAAREVQTFDVSVRIPTADFYVLPVNSQFLEREQKMSWNPVTETLGTLREDFDVRSVLGGITARLGAEPTLFNGLESIVLNVMFNGQRLDLSDNLVVPEDEASAGKRVPLVIAAEKPDAGYRPGQYHGSVQIIFDALRP
jgi:hypothetical protein